MAILEVNNLCKKFGKSNVLKGISFSLEKGEVLTIIGSSGSGKTTLLRCLNFLEEADQGSIAVSGQTLFDAEHRDKMSEETIRKNRLHFGLVFQSFNLFPQYNVLQNVMLAVKLLNKVSRKDKEKLQQIEKQAKTLLERVELGDKILSYPCELSGGQQQRVAIARALALQPDILCFDEPTSALDPELTGEVLKVIRGLKSSDRTMIVVTHEMNFAKNVADKVIFMADGQVEEVGTPEEVFCHPQSEKTIQFLQKSLERI